MGFFRAMLPLVGATAGGISGVVSSNNLDPTARFRDVLLGVGIGAGIGGLFTRTGVSMFGGIGKGIGRGIKKRVGPLFTHEGGIAAQQKIERAVLAAGSGAAHLGRAALQNPLTALSIGGGALGLGAIGYSALNQPGPPSSMDTMNFINRHRVPSSGFTDRDRLQQSTVGLTQAMFRNRHNGG
jgi:hypothetical protein